MQAPVLIISSDDEKDEIIYIAKELLWLIGMEKDLAIHIGEKTLLRISDAVEIDRDTLLNVFNAMSLKREFEHGKDAHGRFDQANIKWDIKKPKVSELVESMGQRLDKVDAQSEFKIIFSHDIDWVSGFDPISLVKSIKSSVSGSRNWIKLSEVFDQDIFVKNYSEMLSIEKKYGVKTWNFMLSGTNGLGRYSNRYNIKSSRAKKVIDLILSSGNFIGLHGSYGASDANTYKEEAELLREVTNQEIISHRNHYLRFDPINLWSQLSSAGIGYDFSVGFSSNMGFRTGVASSYRPYDFKNKSASDITEIPLVFMERNQYLIDERKTLEELKGVLEEVKKYNGCASILFHPESFVVDTRWLPFYEKVINTVVEMGGDVSGTLPRR
ncbi:MAG: polysaccharide deacetylase family protein [Ignavibacteriae bacterium]|nr:polysaccharide deacetylase family protein [Ignavibacteriota bacterium]MCB9244049.1 polysaccharide deacetylase family protein [Ignavibacteriales bacterium]